MVTQLRCLLFLLALLVAAPTQALRSLSPPAYGGEPTIEWEEDLARARKRALEQKKPLLIVFRCPPCKDCAKFDAEVKKAPVVLAKAAAPYVCARVTSLRGIDLDAYAFDFDVNFAVLVLHPDGTLLHRYGGRDHRGADVRHSMTSLVTFLERALLSVDKHTKAIERGKGRTLDSLPVWRNKMAERERRGRKPLGCYHCHYVFDAEREQRKADGTWTRDGVWRWPAPTQVGLSLDPEDHGKVTAVAKGSAAESAGFKVGDRIAKSGEVRLLTALDLSAVLEQAPGGATKLPLVVVRAGAETSLTLALKDGWKRGTSLEFSWRPSKWALHPRPGFGGRPLTPNERARLGIADNTFAFRVGYIVDWGGADDRRYGQAARKAGLRKGDVVIGVEGETLRHQAHFHSWWRLTRKPGDVVALRVIPKAGGSARLVKLTVLAPPPPKAKKGDAKTPRKSAEKQPTKKAP